jgi:hypothetical protein
MALLQAVFFCNGDLNRMIGCHAFWGALSFSFIISPILDDECQALQYLLFSLLLTGAQCLIVV